MPLTKADRAHPGRPFERRQVAEQRAGAAPDHEDVLGQDLVAPDQVADREQSEVRLHLVRGEADARRFSGRPGGGCAEDRVHVATDEVIRPVAQRLLPCQGQLADLLLRQPCGIEAEAGEELAVVGRLPHGPLGLEAQPAEVYLPSGLLIELGGLEQGRSVGPCEQRLEDLVERLLREADAEAPRCCVAQLGGRRSEDRSTSSW